MILRMSFEMLCQVRNLFTKNRNLHFGRTGIDRMRLKRIDYLCLSFDCKCQCILRKN